MVCDAAVYPGLAIKYASTLFPELLKMPWLLSYACKSVYTTVFFCLLLLGVRPVGVTLNVLLFMVLFPTALLFLFGISQVDFAKHSRTMLQNQQLRQIQIIDFFTLSMC